MEDNDYKQELIFRMGVIEGKQDRLIKSVDDLAVAIKDDNKAINRTNEVAIQALASAKSAHHRIDSYKINTAKMIGKITAFVSLLYTIITTWLNYKS